MNSNYAHWDPRISYTRCALNAAELEGMSDVYKPNASELIRMQAISDKCEKVTNFTTSNHNNF